MTLTDEVAVAAAAMIGLSRPAAASGISVTLSFGCTPRGQGIS